MLRPAVLLLALVVTAPTVWDALATQRVPLQTALVHYLIAVPIMAVLCAGVRLAARPAPDPTAPPDPAAPAAPAAPPKTPGRSD